MLLMHVESLLVPLEPTGAASSVVFSALKYDVVTR